MVQLVAIRDYMRYLGISGGLQDNDVVLTGAKEKTSWTSHNNDFNLLLTERTQRGMGEGHLNGENVKLYFCHEVNFLGENNYYCNHWSEIKIM